MKKFQNYITEALKGGLFDEYSKLHRSLMNTMENAFMRAFGKKGGFKITWRDDKLASGYAFSMEGVNRSDLSTELMVIFTVTKWTPSIFRMIITIKSVDMHTSNDVINKEYKFADYDPAAFAKITAQMLGW